MANEQQKIIENWRRYRTINEHKEMSDIETQARTNLAGAKLNRHGNPRGLEPEMEAIERAVEKAEEEERLGNRSAKEKMIDFFKEKIAQLEELVPTEEPTGLDNLISKLAIRENWKRFSNEAPYLGGDEGSGTPASRQGKKMVQQLDQLKSATEDPEGGPPWIGAGEIGEFIAHQGGEKEALAYIEAMRQKIIDLMAEEDEEINFAKENPEYTTRTFDEEEEDV